MVPNMTPDWPPTERKTLSRFFQRSDRQRTFVTTNICPKIHDKILTGSQESEDQKKVQNTQNWAKNTPNPLCYECVFVTTRAMSRRSLQSFRKNNSVVFKK